VRLPGPYCGDSTVYTSPATSRQHPHHRTVLYHHIARVASVPLRHSYLTRSTGCLSLYADNESTTLISNHTMSKVGWLMDDELGNWEGGVLLYSFRFTFGGCQIRISVGTQTAMTEVSVVLATLRWQMPAQYFVIHSVPFHIPSSSLPAVILSFDAAHYGQLPTPHNKQVMMIILIGL